MRLFFPLTNLLSVKPPPLKDWNASISQEIILYFRLEDWTASISQEITLYFKKKRSSLSSSPFGSGKTGCERHREIAKIWFLSEQHPRTHYIIRRPKVKSFSGWLRVLSGRLAVLLAGRLCKWGWVMISDTTLCCSENAPCESNYTVYLGWTPRLASE